MMGLVNMSSRSHQKEQQADWVWSHLYRSALVLVRHPTPEAITEQVFVLKANYCRLCVQYMEGHLLDLSVVLGGEIKKAIERVSLSL